MATDIKVLVRFVPGRLLSLFGSVLFGSVSAKMRGSSSKWSGFSLPVRNAFTGTGDSFQDLPPSGERRP